MSVHSTFYLTEEERLRDLKAEYSKEEYRVRDHEVHYGCPTEDYLERKENKDNEQHVI